MPDPLGTSSPPALGRSNGQIDPLPDPRGGRLHVNEAEAERVRGIFNLYLRERSLIATAAELGRRGWTLKSWVTRKGRARQGRPFDKCNLFGLLTNVIYIGQVNYKGTIYAGKVRGPSPFHPSFVPRCLNHGQRARLAAAPPSANPPA